MLSLKGYNNTTKYGWHDICHHEDLIFTFHVHLFQGDQNLRQFAAALKHHDIVRILDEHKPTLVR